MNSIIRLSILVAIAATILSCKEKIQGPQKVEFPDLGPRIELVYKDGEYMPKSDPIPEAVFKQYSIGTWKLTEIKDVDISGKLTDVDFSYSDGNIYPFFSLRNEGFVRQYIDTPQNKTYIDGSYSYDETTNRLHFNGAVSQHPEFRIFKMQETEMHGSFTSPDNDSDDSVLTIYIYQKLSYEQEVGLDIIFGAEQINNI
jgi:hypothetical protein